MTYALLSDLETRFGAQRITELSDPTDIGSLQVGVVDQALADADEEINGYVGSIYQLPLANPPVLLTSIAADIALYRLHSDLATEQVSDRYKSAISRLRDIARGTIKLDVAGVEPPQRPDLIVQQSQPRRFDRCSMRDW